MKTRIVFTFLFLSFPLLSQDEFVRGIYMFGNPTGDFQRLRDSLHLNWVQASVNKWDTTLNPDQYSWRSNVLSNSGQLKIAAVIEASVNPRSEAQRMVFEAEQDNTDPLMNYFATRNGTLDGSLYRSFGSAGYLVQGAVPDNEYRYGKTHYIASFILKRENPQSGDPLVARLEAWCKSTSTLLAYRDLRAVTDFSSNNLETKTLEFDISYTPAPIPTPRINGVLMAGKSIQEVLTCTGVDIRVYWYGNLTVWLDKAIVEDVDGHNLFTGVHDDILNSNIQYVSNFPLVKRLYMRDEPEISSFLSFKYIQDKSHLIYGSPADGTGSAITATDKPFSFERYILDVEPHELMVDRYPITADLPIPPAYMSASEASDVGIAAFTTDANYEQILQSQVQTDYLDNSIKPAANIAKVYGKSLWIIPQLHGVYFELSGKFRYPILGNQYDNGAMQRPPTGNEVKLLCNLAIAYGAKGLIPFTHGTDRLEWKDSKINEGWSVFPGLVSSTPDGDGVYRNHWSNYGVFNSPTGPKSIWVGYKDKYDALADVNSTLISIGPTLVSLSWQGTKSWHNGATSGTWLNKITSASTNVFGEVNYVETGHLVAGGLDYVFIVNRRTLASESRTINLVFDNTKAWDVLDIKTGATVSVPVGTFFQAVNVAPGEGRLYKVALNSPPSTPQNFTVTPEPVASNYKPRLNWSANPESDIKHYKIYRDLTTEPGWVNIATVNAPATTYFDPDVVIRSNPAFNTNRADYKVLAVDQIDQNSPYSAVASINFWINAKLLPGEKQLTSIDIPESIFLNQNHPNPFNPSTTVVISLPEPSFVSLKVYDALGREVRQVATGMFSAGYRTFVFDASELPSGVYLARLEVVPESGAKPFIQTRKMVLSK